MNAEGKTGQFLVTYLSVSCKRNWNNQLEGRNEQRIHSDTRLSNQKADFDMLGEKAIAKWYWNSMILCLVNKTIN